MPRYLVVIYEQRSYSREIDAENPQHAKELAKELELTGEPDTVCTEDVLLAGEVDEGDPPRDDG